MGMGKGGEQTTTVELPDFLEEAAEQAIGMARKQGKIGFVPYKGPTVAAFSPMQEASIRNTGNAANAFGMAGGSIGAGAGMPKAQTFAGGVKGYSPFDLFMEAWKKVPNWQQERINDFQGRGSGSGNGGGGGSGKPSNPLVGTQYNGEVWTGSNWIPSAFWNGVTR